MAEAAEKKKRRTFRKYTYRGVDLDQLLDMTRYLIWFTSSKLTVNTSLSLTIILPEVKITRKSCVNARGIPPAA